MRRTGLQAGVMVLATALVLAFVATALWIATQVRSLRVETAEAVAWMSEVHRLDTVARAMIAGEQQPVLSADTRVDLERLVGASKHIESAANASPEVVDTLTRGVALSQAWLSADPGPANVAAAAQIQDWATLAVPVMRQRTRLISEGLSAAWDRMELVVLLACVVALVALALLAFALRQRTRAEQLAGRLAGTRDELARAEKHAALARMLAQLSHELNNPLTVVTNGLAPIREYAGARLAASQELETLLAGSALEPDWRALRERHDLDFIDEDGPAAVETVHHAAERMRGIMAQLRDNLAGRGQGPIDGQVDLRAITRTTLDMVRRISPATVTLTGELEDIPVFRGDPGQIAQVLHNLIKNAVDSVGDDGTVDVKLRIDDNRAVLDVVDDGPGVPAEIADRIFEPFYTTKAVGSGTGLGLSISRQLIVEGHGGELELIPAERGACFRITLPLTAVSANANANANANGVAPR